MQIGGGTKMSSIMEPIFSYLYRGIPMEQRLEYINTKELDEQAILALCQKVVANRFEMGAEQSHYLLEDRNNRFHSSIHAKYFVYFFFLHVVMAIERYDSYHVKEYYQKLKNFTQELEEDDLAAWHDRLWLVALMVQTVNEEKLMAEEFEWSVMISSMDKAPHFEICIFLGSYAVQQEQFPVASSLLTLAGIHAKSLYHKAILAANNGAFYYYQNDLERSIECYEEAHAYTEGINEISAVEKEILFKEIKWNLNNIKHLLHSFRGEFVQPSISYKSDESELIKVDRILLQASANARKEQYERNFQSRQGFRMSNQLFEMDRKFQLAERYYSVMGSVNGLQASATRKVQEYVNMGYSLNDSLLLRIALYEGVKANDEKAIKNIILQRFPFHNEEQLIEFLEWLISGSISRNMVIGRIFAFEALADYVPEVYINQMKGLLLEAFNQEYSFFKTFDYKRPAIRAIGTLLPRLEIEAQKDIIQLLISAWKGSHFQIRHEIGKSLSLIDNWESHCQSFLEHLLDQLWLLMEQVDKDDPDFSYIIQLIFDLSEFVSQETQKKVVGKLVPLWKGGLIILYPMFLHPWLRDFLDVKEMNSFFNWCLKEVERKLAQRPDGVITFSGYNFAIILAHALSVMKEVDFIEKGKKLLISYVFAPHIQPYDRFETLGAIGSVQSDVMAYFMPEQIKEMALAILEEQLDKVQSSKFDMMGDRNQSTVIYAGAFRLLEFANLTLEEQLDTYDVFNERTTNSDGYLKSQCLISISRFCLNYSENRTLIRLVFQQLYIHAKDEDERVRSVVAYWLPRITEIFDRNTAISRTAQVIMMHLASDSHRSVRLHLVHGLQFLSDEKRLSLSVVMDQLRNDMSYLVRKGVTDGRVGR
jgi:hypothetical protein